uniref:Alanine--tRNA ligase n=1 Tax=Anthurium amnicola TaxID=1678845 RepID=A0A1D1ZBR9_9ARAE
MAYNSQDTSNSYSQHNNISMPIQPQQGQPKEKIQQSELEKRQKKIAQNAHKRKSLTMESERDKQKAELEKSGNELKSLLAQFGTKAKVADEIDNDAKKLRSSIEALMAKAHAKVNNKPIQPIQVTPPPPLSQVPQISQPPQSQSPAIEQQQGLFTSIWENLLYIILFPFNLIINLLRLVYNSINWTVLLSCILLIELMIIGLIWTVRRNHYNYAYVEPYEAVVHGTFGVEQTTWGISSAVNSISDFIAEVMNGGRGFGSPSYDGFVPI